MRLCSWERLLQDGHENRRLQKRNDDGGLMHMSFEVIPHRDQICGKDRQLHVTSLTNLSIVEAGALTRMCDKV